MVLEQLSSGLKWLRNWFTIDVLAVPGPPTSSDDCRTTKRVNFCHSYRRFHVLPKAKRCCKCRRSGGDQAL